MTDKQLNPFQRQVKAAAAMSSDEARAIQEVQAALIIANRFPRDEATAMDAILQACTRPALAELGQYAFPRGGSMVTGGSIRLAEAIAQRWGNLQFGVRELSQTKGESVVEAFAWDLQSNTQERRQFIVRHTRKALGRMVELEDARDIYEMAANQGARRLRSCIFAIVPREVVDAAVSQCDLTLQHTAGAPVEEIKKLVAAFQGLGVAADQLRKRLGHTLESTIAAEVIGLRKIYASLRDGMSAPADWFPVEAPAAAPTVAPGDGVAALNARLDQMSEEPKTTPPPAAQAPAEPEQWPRRASVIEDPTMAGAWTDSAGTLYDSASHGWSHASQAPAVTRDGVFRARRGRKADIRETDIQRLDDNMKADKERLATPVAPVTPPPESEPAMEVEAPPWTEDAEQPAATGAAVASHPDYPKFDSTHWRDATDRIYNPYTNGWDPIAKRPQVNFQGKFVSKQADA